MSVLNHECERLSAWGGDNEEEGGHSRLRLAPLEAHPGGAKVKSPTWVPSQSGLLACFWLLSSFFFYLRHEFFFSSELKHINFAAVGHLLFSVVL